MKNKPTLESIMKELNTLQAELSGDLQALDGVTDDMRYVVIRTYSAGVHTGFLKDRDGPDVTLVHSRRIYRWAGAFTLSELSVSGPLNPKESQFSVPVSEIILTGAIEIIPTTKIAQKRIMSVPNHETK